ncbi:glycosyltransferase family 92 protein F13G3.3-like [Liolophura sinensis]|uniref:glycosyltransferase family 92 protein F13G3.3-like n=1 Tax=Liolophura sinensis TaxID=3198878 RepID=UPI0031588C96
MYRYRKRKVISGLLVCSFVVITYKALKAKELTTVLKYGTVKYGQRLNRRVCPEVRRPELVPDTETWQGLSVWPKDISTTLDRVYVFSAYMDGSLKRLSSNYANLVRIIAMASSEIGTPFCQLWFNNDRELLIVPASLEPIPEDHDRPYKACYFVCNIPSLDIPYAVSLVQNKCDQPRNILPVQQERPGKKKYTVCVTPLNMHYNNIYQLVEMIEVNRLFGADVFVFYNNSIGSEVNDLLMHYQSESLLETVQWKIPVKGDTWPPTSSVDIHYFGQLAALNDCLFRHRSSEFIVFTDLDELIVPRGHETWDEMLATLESKGPNDVFTFLCTFFRTEWPDFEESFDNKIVAHKYRLMTLLKVNREPQILSPHARSKFMVRPATITAVGIHIVWSRFDGSGELIVDPSVGLLHHYRNWEKPGDTNRLSDPYLHKFDKKITDAISHRWKKISSQMKEHSIFTRLACLFLRCTL